MNPPPKLDLARLPTPLQPLDRLSDALGGPRIWIKRDDLTEAAGAGNKIRKLEFVLADAINQGATALITSGGLQSNHCRATALFAAQLGLQCHLILRGSEARTANGNLLLNQLLGANIDYVSDANWKLIVENFIDSYHVKWIHKELDATTPMTTYRHETVGNISIGRAPAPLSRPGYGGNMPGWPGMSEESTQTLTYLALFPNLLLVFSSDQMTCFHLMPDGPFRTRERIKFYMPHDALSPEFETDRTESVNAYRKLNDEDVWLVEELQQSRRSPAFDGGRFSPHWDRITHHFAKQVAEAVLA